eukprot:scaffold6417_cov87-Cyclotella_meneghiniana.AAC.13
MPCFNCNKIGNAKEMCQDVRTAKSHSTVHMIVLWPLGRITKRDAWPKHKDDTGKIQILDMALKRVWYE